MTTILCSNDDTNCFIDIDNDHIAAVGSDGYLDLININSQKVISHMKQKREDKTYEIKKTTKE